MDRGFVREGVGPACKLKKDQLGMLFKREEAMFGQMRITPGRRKASASRGTTAPHKGGVSATKLQENSWEIVEASTHPIKRGC